MKILWLLVVVILIVMLPANAVGQSVPSAFIGSPVHHSTFLTTDNILFSGSGDEAKGGNLIGDSMVWTSDIDGQIGTGESFTRSLTVGNHVITLTVTDSDGDTGDAIVTIMVTSPGGVPTPTPAPTEAPTPEPTATSGGGDGGAGGGGTFQPRRRRQLRWWPSQPQHRCLPQPQCPCLLRYQRPFRYQHRRPLRLVRRRSRQRRQHLGPLLGA